MLKRHVAALLFFAFSAAAAPSIAPAVRSHVRVATSGDGYLVIWNEGESVYGVRLTREGHRLDSKSILIANGAAGSVVWNGTTYLVGYVTKSDAGEVVPVSAAGAVGSATLVASMSGGVVELASGPAATIAAMRARTVFLPPSDRTMLAIDTSPWSLLAAAAADQTFVHSGEFDGTIGWFVYDSAGREINGCCVYIGFPPREEPTGMAVASNGLGFLLLWTDAFERVYATPLTINGLGKKTEASIVSLADETSAPRAAWDGLQYVATTSVGRTLHLLRYGIDGKAIGSPIAVEAMRVGAAADITAHDDGRGAVAWIREGGDIRIGFFDAASLAAGAPFYNTTDVNRVSRRRAVR